MTNRPPEDGKESWLETAADILKGNPFDIINRIRSKLGRAVQSPEEFVTLPWSIRNKLATGNAQLDTANLQELALHRCWQDCTAYLLLKALDGNTDTQEAVLKELTTAYRQQDLDSVSVLLQEGVARLPEDTQVLGTKLAQVNRYGPANWHVKMQELSQRMKKGETTPCLVAYSMLTGLRAFIEQAEDGDHILVMVKHRIEHDKDHSLFLITCQEDHCDIEEWTHAHNTNGIEEIHLVDDTIRSGTTMEQTRDCLNEKIDFMPRIGEQCYCMIDASGLGERLELQ